MEPIHAVKDVYLIAAVNICSFVMIPSFIVMYSGEGLIFKLCTHEVVSENI